MFEAMRLSATPNDTPAPIIEIPFSADFMRVIVNWVYSTTGAALPRLKAAFLSNRMLLEVLDFADKYDSSELASIVKDSFGPRYRGQTCWSFMVEMLNLGRNEIATLAMREMGAVEVPFEYKQLRLDLMDYHLDLVVSTRES